ncbi:4-hydroxythreonine-4-phosphate dehydrogenase [Helicobacter winghamensis]|uniref:4-hydroxythreonine-4-phosphate dehydrogenase n=1 Tax=Helicobacter winghamensis TaxID=157268 RepID=A0A2N3PJR4_9HELI|nr:4-hydroxythreonine-4-phosphate dehydrogenase [Helicobacter winghamensis]PKT77252.1 4-hydroxythreonine-4-phosphate dehydrogenase PdxA [Helicobacter winghamensis]PKT81418.1 4-hydroxythreonine-4-phosphate dehydrogenase PdxA [Helicobacter winghamensis]PKT81595.1 4-hydroxythreonine-4-phosphate dehydrogenase PdxA [Helicobacter winghamensis]
MKIAVSIGDPNGVGLEILLKNHKKICKFCNPVYCVDKELLKEAAKILKFKLPKNLKCVSPKVMPSNIIPKITPGAIQKESGAYSYASFLQALNLTLVGKTKAMVTLPIHKKAWQLAGVSYAGHTEALRDVFKFENMESKINGIQNQKAIMMLGSPKLYVALFSDHIPLKNVPSLINIESLKEFLLDFAPYVLKMPCGVLGLNPHAGDFGVLGDEDNVIRETIRLANASLGKEVFIGPLVPDTAFVGKHLRYYVAMYHDQGLIPLKTLYFKESINITLNLPVIRTSVDHGTAFDIAYKNKAESKSYINAIKEAILRQC